MEPSLPTGRTGQMLALGLTALVLAAVWLGVAMPLLEWHSERAEALTQRAGLARQMVALAASVPVLQEQVATVAATGADEPALLDGDSDSMASASLLERLQAMMIRTGVQLNSVETLPGEDAGAQRRIRVRVSFNARWPALMALLKEVHVATPLLLVDELQVHPALHRISTAPSTFDGSCSVFAFRSGVVRAAVR